MCKLVYFPGVYICPTSKIKKKIIFMNLNDKENLIIISKSVTDPESVVNGNYH